MTTGGQGTSAAKPSTPLQRLADGVVTRVQGLPAPRNDYTVTRDLRIPMRDGVELLADMYAPAGPSVGTILERSPYGWPAPMVALTGSVFSARGYRVLLAR